MHRLIIACAILLGMTAYAYSASASPWNDPLSRGGSGIQDVQAAGTATPSLTTGSPTPTSMPTPTPVADTASMQVLLQRLLTYSYPGAPTQQTQIYVGKTPDRLPVDLPLPDGSRVIGSVVREGENIQIVLDAPLTPDRVLDFYRQRMQAAGWSAQDQPTAPGGGFVASSIPTGLTLCQSRSGPSLFVNASATSGQLADVRLTLNTNKTQAYSCSPQPGGQLGTEQLIPRLVAPAGARQIEGGSGGSSTGSSYNSATLAIDQNAAALATFYGDQLSQAGWTKQDSGQSGPLSWSTWSLQDKQGTSWKGLFFALDLWGAPSRRFVHVRVDMP